MIVHSLFHTAHNIPRFKIAKFCWSASYLTSGLRTNCASRIPRQLEVRLGVLQEFTYQWGWCFRSSCWQLAFCSWPSVLWSRVRTIGDGEGRLPLLPPVLLLLPVLLPLEHLLLLLLHHHHHHRLPLHRHRHHHHLLPHRRVVLIRLTSIQVSVLVQEMQSARSFLLP